MEIDEAAEGNPFLGHSTKEPVASNFLIIFFNAKDFIGPLPSGITFIK